MLFFSVSIKNLELYLSSLRRDRANPFCIVRGTAVNGVLFAGQDGDRLNEAAIELTSAVGPAKDWFSDHSKKKPLQIVVVIFAQGPCR